MINTIIFDFGGVLGTNSDTILFEILSKYGYQREDFDNFWLKYWPDLKLGKMHVDFFWNKAKNFIKEDIQTIENKYNELISIDPEMHSLSKNLKSENFKLGILANESLEWMDIKRQKGNLDETFDVVYSSADLKIAKPDPKAYKKTLSALESEPEESLFIDNLERNTKVAEQIGIKSIVYKNTNTLKKELNKLLKINL
jgi:putative hydrolase of the HAD superfamily